MTILTIGEALTLLRVSRSWLYRYLDEIPHYKIDHLVRFSREQLLEWLQSKEEGGGPMKQAISGGG